MEPELLVVGTGILPGLHITREAEHAIMSAERVLHLVADKITASVIHDMRSDAESLLHHYEKAKERGDDRSVVYRGIVEQIVATVRSGQKTCAVFYGHPGVFSSPAHDSICQVRTLGFKARMAPAVSAEDALFCDLGIDPGMLGCQSYEATHLIGERPNIEPQAHLIVWQIGVIGRRDVIVASEDLTVDPIAIKAAQSYLTGIYGTAHPAILYTASTLPGISCATKELALGELATAKIDPIATLYVPPIGTVCRAVQH